MRMMAALLFVMVLAGCSSGENYFRLEEYGEGWKLSVKEDGESFKASWAKGDHRSTKLVGYAPVPGADYYLLNTLYLELDDDGTIVNGRLKRVVLPDFEQRLYYEQNAQWFRVLEGRCLLDEKLSGTVDVRCEGGYEFQANVEPINDIEILKPER